MDKFNTLFENTLPSTIKLVKRIHYPKQIQFSESFLKSLEKEFKRLQYLQEFESETDTKPVIKNFKENFQN